MIRNIDIVALRSFVAVAETGGVTRAAAKLHLSQSAVSMQLKRLEMAIGQQLVARVGRGIALTGNGELLLGYARRILSLNDEAWNRLTHASFEGHIAIGVPHDLIQPHIPTVLRKFSIAFPRIEITLTTKSTLDLKALLATNNLDLILTTETTASSGAELLYKAPLKWYGAIGGTAWSHRPLALAYEPNCMFKPHAIAALDKAGISWSLPFTGTDWREYAAFVSADMAITGFLKDTNKVDWELVPERSGLPPLPAVGIYLYMNETSNSEIAAHMAGFIRDEFYRQAS